MRWRSNTGSNNNGWQPEGAVQIVAGSAQARNDFITYVAEDIDYSHVSPRQNHATSHILPGAYFLSNSHSQTTEKYMGAVCVKTLVLSNVYQTRDLY